MKCLNMRHPLLLFSIFLALGCSQPDDSPITWTECGGNIGDHACNFSFMDQTGNDWSLYNHHGSIIVLDFSAMWCDYCKKAAEVAQEIQNTHENDDVVWVTILLQNNYGQQPTLENLNEWASSFEMTSSPVLSGDASIIDPTAQKGYNVTTWPGLVVIDRDMTISHELKGWNEMQIKFWLKQLTKNREAR